MTEDEKDIFTEQVKTILSGYIDRKDTINYLAVKIRQLHEEEMKNSCNL
ncbi:hypothetical protein [Blautia sp. TM10-2]|jgi:hypothetical protein|nr:hypothetical protein [Blautia sp. TM10-2]DAO11761.1 MAG TPA: hypothetical protein [Caudoviricetes sp.]